MSLDTSASCSSKILVIVEHFRFLLTESLYYSDCIKCLLSIASTLTISSQIRDVSSLDCSSHQDGTHEDDWESEEEYQREPPASEECKEES